MTFPSVFFFFFLWHPSISCTRTSWNPKGDKFPPPPPWRENLNNFALSVRKRVRGVCAIRQRRWHPEAERRPRGHGLLALRGVRGNHCQLPGHRGGRRTCWRLPARARRLRPETFGGKKNNNNKVKLLDKMLILAVLFPHLSHLKRKVEFALSEQLGEQKLFWRHCSIVQTSLILFAHNKKFTQSASENWFCNCIYFSVVLSASESDTFLRAGRCERNRNSFESVVHPLSHRHRFVHCKTSMFHHVAQSDWSIHALQTTFLFFFFFFLISRIDSGANLITGKIFH